MFPEDSWTHDKIGQVVFIQLQPSPVLHIKTKMSSTHCRRHIYLWFHIFFCNYSTVTITNSICKFGERSSQKTIASINVRRVMHYSAVILGETASLITSVPTVCLSAYSAQIKENIKAPRHWPLCGEFTGDRWIPRTGPSNASIWWRHHGKGAT